MNKIPDEFEGCEWNDLPPEERGKKIEEAINSYMDPPDSPSYGIVKACEGLGFKKPLDRKWIKILLPSLAACFCGMQISRPTPYNFTFSEENKDKNCQLFITQCEKCLKIYWSDKCENP